MKRRKWTARRPPRCQAVAPVCVASAILVLAVSSSTSVSAQPSSTQAALAIQLYEDAEKLVAMGNPAAACPKYAESQRLDPQLGTLLHLADCHEQEGKLASAWAGYKEAAEIAARRNAAGNNEPRERVARARAAALGPRLSTVVIHVTESDVAGFEIRQDGKLVDRAVWGATMPVDPGSYTFAVQAPGKKPWTKTVEVHAGGVKVDITVPALEDERVTSSTSGTSNVVTAADASSAVGASRGTTQRTAGYLLTGLGVIGVGVGVGLRFVYGSQREERDNLCPKNLCTYEEAQKILDLEDKMQRSLTGSTVSLAIGGAAAVAGVALLLTAPSSPSPGVNGLAVVPWGGVNAAGASVTGRW